MKIFPLFIGLILLFGSCTEELVEIQPADTGKKQIMYTSLLQKVQPAYDFDYWELNYIDKEGRHHLIYGTGDLCAADGAKKDCIKEFGTVARTTRKIPGRDSFFIRTNEKGYNTVWIGNAELLRFTGQIDSPGDALLVAIFRGLYEPLQQRFSGTIVRNGNGDYILDGKQVTNACRPLRVDRYQATVSASGKMSNYQSAFYLELEEECL